MFMIVFYHFAVHTDFDFKNDEYLLINRLFVDYLGFFGKASVNIFILISGYFLCEKTEIKHSKALKLWLQVLFYSILLYAVSVLFLNDRFSYTSLFFSFFPISMKEWWFASNYIVLFLLSPFINKLLQSIDSKRFVYLIVLFSLISTVIPTVLNYNYFCNHLLWFIYVYIVGAAIKRYNVLQKLNSIYLFIIALLVSLIAFFIHYYSNNYLDIGMIKDRIFFPYDAQNVLELSFAILVFCAFSKIKIKYNPFINTLSSATFGVYLIHDHPAVREFVWNVIICGNRIINKQYFIVYEFISVLAVYIVCTIIEFIRKYTVEKLYSKRLNKVDSLFERLLK